jgi:hypothetical protein
MLIDDPSTHQRVINSLPTVTPASPQTSRIERCSTSAAHSMSPTTTTTPLVRGEER